MDIGNDKHNAIFVPAGLPLLDICGTNFPTFSACGIFSQTNAVSSDAHERGPKPDSDIW